MVKRWLVRLGMGLVVILVVGSGLLAVRPDLRAAVARMNVFPPALDPLLASDQAETPKPGTAAEPERPVEWVDDGWCALHGKPEALCEACASRDPGKPRTCAEKLPIVRLSSPEVARRIGLSTAPVVERPHADRLTGSAEVVYDANSYAEIRPRVAGFNREVLADEGLAVKKGEPLLVIDSAEVGSAKAAYLGAIPLVDLATATLERTRSLTRADALPLKDELEAQTSLNRAKAELLNASQRLRNLGFSNVDLEAMAKSQDTSSLLQVLSPIEGTVVQRHAVSGEAVEANTQVFVVADIRQMWAWIDVYENEIERVKPGQKVGFWVGGTQGQAHEGVVDWIDSAVNPTTRTIRVRAVLANRDGRLRANQFGRAEILVGEEHQAVFVPREAIQQVGEQRLVFVERSEGVYRPQRVLLRSAEPVDGLEEVAWGLHPGEKVVTTGSFLLKSELLKDELAGD